VDTYLRAGFLSVDFTRVQGNHHPLRQRKNQEGWYVRKNNRYLYAQRPAFILPGRKSRRRLTPWHVANMDTLIPRQVLERRFYESVHDTILGYAK